MMRTKIIAIALIAPLLVGCGQTFNTSVNKLKVKTHVGIDDGKASGYITYTNSAGEVSWFLFRSLDDLNNFETKTNEAVKNMRKQMEK